jgi:hypothetical protein
LSSSKKLFLSITVMFSLFFISINIAEANIISYYETVYNTDYTSSGISGVRGQGTGNITLQNVTGTVTKSYLYWHGPSNNTDPAANATITLNGTYITGSNIGIADDNCWDCEVSHAYRADVTEYVTGVGTYALADMYKAGHPKVDINGASLMVFYDDGDDSNNRDIVIFNGNDSNISSDYDPEGWDVTFSGINYTSGDAYIELHVGDGQEPLEGGDDADVYLNGATLLTGPPIFQGDTLPDAGSTAWQNNYGLLWDIVSPAITSWLSPGMNDLNLTSGYINDCLSLVVANIDLPAGAAPDPIPEPATMLLLGSGLVCLAGTRRKLRKS